MTSSSESLRDVLVERTAQIISLKGLSGLRLDELVGGIGATKGAFFHYFDGKKDVALAAVKRAEEDWWNVVFAPVQEGASPWQRLSIMLDRLLDVAVDELWAGGCFFLALGAEVDDQEPELADPVKEFFLHWQGAIEEFVSLGIEAGQFRSTVDPAEVARLIMATAEGGVLLSRLWQNTDVYRRIIEVLRESLAGWLLSKQE